MKCPTSFYSVVGGISKNHTSSGYQRTTVGLIMICTVMYFKELPHVNM